MLPTTRAVGNTFGSMWPTRIDGAPAPVKEGVNREEADSIKGQLEEAGASVEIK